MRTLFSAISRPGHDSILRVGSLGLEQELYRPELLAQHQLTRAAQPAVQHRGIDLAEIDSVFRVAVLQVLQVWIGAVQARRHGRTQDKDRAGSAVVGTAAGVLLEATAELREDEHQHTLGVARLV